MPPTQDQTVDEAVTAYAGSELFTPTPEESGDNDTLAAKKLEQEYNKK